MENEPNIRKIYWPRDRRGTIKVWCTKEVDTKPIAKCSNCEYYRGAVFGKGVKCSYKEPK